MGEITANDKFGADIIRITRDEKLSSILEIGSWDGTGSTQCFIKGLSDVQNKRMVCLEVSKDRYAHLKNNTAQYPWIECYNQSSISYNNLVYKDFDDIWSSPFNKIRGTGTPEQKQVCKQWFDDDVKVLQSYTTGYLEDHPTDLYDGVLIDGSEFTGYSEFLLLKDRTKVFFLDDYYSAFKTNQIARVLQDSGWPVLGHDKYTRNGYVIFKAP